MLVSEYAAQCPNWGRNSAVVLATSTDPEGPYIKQFRLFGVMSHEAMLARGDGGEWIVYFTAKQVAGRATPAEGTDADNVHGTLCTRSSLHSKCSCPGGGDGMGSMDPTWMAQTKVAAAALSHAAPATSTRSRRGAAC